MSRKERSGCFTRDSGLKVNDEDILFSTQRACLVCVGVVPDVFIVCSVCGVCSVVSVVGVDEVDGAETEIRVTLTELINISNISNVCINCGGNRGQSHCVCDSDALSSGVKCSEV